MINYLIARRTTFLQSSKKLSKRFPEEFLQFSGRLLRSVRAILLHATVVSFITSSFFALTPLTSLEAYPIKVKDLTELAGVKKNFFSGYGLVTGLSGTGDRRSRFTQKSLSTLMQSNGIQVEDRLITTRNTASVIITAEATGFLEKGDKIDVIVASMGDARSLANGVLLPTPLKAGNGSIYLVASGVLSLSDSTNNSTRAVVLEGGVVERDFMTTESLDLLNNPETNPVPPLLYNRTNVFLKVKGHNLENASRIKTQLEQNFTNLTVSFSNDKNLVLSQETNELFNHARLVEILQTEIEIPAPRIVVIDQISGIVVTGGEVVIEPSYISLRDLSLEISVPTFSAFDNLGLDSIDSSSDQKIFYTTVEELLTELQDLNLDGYKIGSIFKALKKSGAINAEIVFQ